MYFAIRGLIVVACLFLVSDAYGQNSSRLNAIMRDMRGTNSTDAEIESSRPGQEMRVSYLQDGSPTGGYSVMQAPTAEPTAAIPKHLLPDVYVSEPSFEMSGQVELQPASELTYEVYVPERFIFSSASQRGQSNDRSKFSSLLNDQGCCDEWTVMCPCESCCEDLGLNPWSGRTVRRGCGIGRHWAHGAECGCRSCGSAGYSPSAVQR